MILGRDHIHRTPDGLRKTKRNGNKTEGEQRSHISKVPRRGGSQAGRLQKKAMPCEARITPAQRTSEKAPASFPGSSAAKTSERSKSSFTRNETLL